jgi:hypothetical protein
MVETQSQHAMPRRDRPDLWTVLLGDKEVTMLRLPGFFCGLCCCLVACERETLPTPETLIGHWQGACTSNVDFFEGNLEVELTLEAGQAASGEIGDAAMTEVRLTSCDGYMVESCEAVLEAKLDSPLSDAPALKRASISAFLWRVGDELVFEATATNFNPLEPVFECRGEHLQRTSE